MRLTRLTLSFACLTLSVPTFAEGPHRDRYCQDHPEHCNAEPDAKAASTRSTLNLVPTAGDCSRGGDEVAYPVYRVVNGEVIFAGFECRQSN